MHVDEPYARSTRFGKRIAHGGVAAGLVSPILGMQMPGAGTVPLRFRYKYLAPVYPGDTITCLGRLTEKDLEHNSVTIHFKFSNQEDKLVLECLAEVAPPKKSP
jgi:acyl dehydratase